MIKQIKKYLKEVESFSIKDPEAIDLFRVKYAGKKGILNKLFSDFKGLPNKEKKAYGQELNTLK